MARPASALPLPSHAVRNRRVIAWMLDPAEVRFPVFRIALCTTFGKPARTRRRPSDDILHGFAAEDDVSFGYTVPVAARQECTAGPRCGRACGCGCWGG